MKNRTIHENLDTSFVNLPALIRYLRRRQFSGRVRVELSGYEADILISEDNQMTVREYDQIAGRIAEGDEALQRILIRSREPGGIVSVHQTLNEPESPVAAAPLGAVNPIGTEALTASSSIDFYANGTARSQPADGKDARPALPNLPFEFTNRVEAKAKAASLSPDDAVLLVSLVGELLGTADKALSMAKLNFAGAYHKACMEICTDYPFLMSLEYGGGKVTVPELPAATIFVAGALEALRRILDKLGAHPKFGEVHKFTNQKLAALAAKRRDLYQKFGIAPLLNRILGS